MSLYGYAVLYSLAICAATVVLMLMCKRDQLKNYKLLVLLIGILAYSVPSFIGLIQIKEGNFDTFADRVGPTGELVTHWTITESYLQVAFAARQTVSLDVYLNSPDRTAEI